MLLVHDRAVQIGCKFLQNIAGHIQAELNAVFPSRISNCPIVRIPRLGNSNRSRVTPDFRNVELSFPVVAVGDKDLPASVFQSGPRAPRTAPKIARVLMENGRVDRLGHEVARRNIAES